MTLQAQAGNFELIETILWTGGKFCLLDYHLDRLRGSAERFGISLSATAAKLALAGAANAHPGQAVRVRLTVSIAGALAISSTAIPSGWAPWRTISLSEVPVDSGDGFLFHKTTHRRHFDTELARLAAHRKCDEAIFVNQRGELTEGARSTLFIERAGRFFTPPIECGLLPGTLRRFLIERQPIPLEERILRPPDLDAADRIYVGNSVRGLMCVKLA